MQKDTRVPPPGQRVAPQHPAVLEHDLPRQVQADPDAGLLLAKRSLARGERLLERARRDVAVQSLPLVRHRHDDPFVEGARRELDDVLPAGE